MKQRGDAGAESGPPAPQSAVAPRRKWALTPEAFGKLLAFLGPDRESAGEKYLEHRNNLLRFFE
jgi:hypothetical protein